jgi:hypothetical protein
MRMRLSYDHIILNRDKFFGLIAMISQWTILKLVVVEPLIYLNSLGFRAPCSQSSMCFHQIGSARMSV